MPKARARRATSMPILSQPDNAQRLRRAVPSLAAISSPTCRRASSASARHKWRAMASIIPSVCSATATALAPGVFITAMPFVRRGLEIDVVHAHAGSPDHAQLLRVLQKLGVRLHRRTHYQRIRSLQMLRQFAVQLIRSEDRPARFLQLRYR